MNVVVSPRADRFTGEALILSELRKEVLECIDRIPDSKLEGPSVPFCVC